VRPPFASHAARGPMFTSERQFKRSWLLFGRLHLSGYARATTSMVVFTDWSSLGANVLSSRVGYHRKVRTSPLVGLLGVWLFAGCQSSSSTQSTPETPETPEVPREVDEAKVTTPTALPTCCKDQDELAALDGQRVEVRGVYQKVNVSRRPPPLDLTVPGNASIRSDSVGVMLGIYYEASSVRSVVEIQRLHKKEVLVTGTIHVRTPTQIHDGIPMQTMIGPYIEVESLKAVNAQTP